MCWLLLFVSRTGICGCVYLGDRLDARISWLQIYFTLQWSLVGIGHINGSYCKFNHNFTTKPPSARTCTLSVGQYLVAVQKHQFNNSTNGWPYLLKYNVKAFSWTLFGLDLWCWTDINFISEIIFLVSWHFCKFCRL